MWSGFMIPAWEAATMVAVVAGVAGYFVVIRDSAFAAHSLPSGAFAGGAGATLIGVSPVLGMAAFSVAGALAIAGLGRRARRDVATALTIVALLAAGALFVSIGGRSAADVDGLLFGQILGVSPGDLEAIAGMGLVTLVAAAATFRPLTLASVMPDSAAVRGVRGSELMFLLLVALVTSAAVPVVGALLVFSLLVGPPAAAAVVATRPAVAVAAGVGLALALVWGSVALAYYTDLPIGFLVGTGSAAVYLLARITRSAGPALQSRSRSRRPTPRTA